MGHAGHRRLLENRLYPWSLLFRNYVTPNDKNDQMGLPRVWLTSDL